jgi:hypothetical protein
MRIPVCGAITTSTPSSFPLAPELRSSNTRTAGVLDALAGECRHGQCGDLLAGRVLVRLQRRADALARGRRQDLGVVGDAPGEEGNVERERRDEPQQR